jgi:hypothetical protein
VAVPANRQRSSASVYAVCGLDGLNREKLRLISDNCFAVTEIETVSRRPVWSERVVSS